MTPWKHTVGALLLAGALLSGVPGGARAQSNPDLDKVSSSPIPSPAARSATLAEGDPPLTQEMVDRYNLFFEWVLDVQTTQEQRRILQEGLIANWKTKNAADMKNAMSVVNMQKQIEQRSDTEREYLRQTLQTRLLQEIGKQPDNEGGRWMLSLYNAAHQPIAPGKPALTRQMSDAFLEVLFFMRREIVGDTVQANKDVRDRFAKELSAVYVKADAVRQKHIAGMPMVWAALRVEWPGLSEEKRGEYRKQWRDYLKGVAPAFLEPVKSVAQRPTSQQSPGAYEAAVARLQSSHNAYVMMSNLAMMKHVTNMNIISTMGGSGWHYEYRYHP